MKVGDLVKWRASRAWKDRIRGLKSYPLRKEEYGIVLEVKLSKEAKMDYRMSDAALVFWPSIGCKWEWQKELERTNENR